jgi:hypothetical protein
MFAKRLRVMVLVALIGPATSLAQDCLGDCNSNGQVQVNELIIGVNIALGRALLETCPEFDAGGGTVPITSLITAVRNALNGCGAPTPTVTSEPDATPTAEANAIFQGALVRSTGRFTYQATVGIDGAEAECAAQYPGTHVCSIDELRDAETAGELTGAADSGGNVVESFWAIDPTRPDVDQCEVTVPWDYATAHTGQFADAVTLDNTTGALGALQEDTLCVQQRWVGCCL